MRIKVETKSEQPNRGSTENSNHTYRTRQDYHVLDLELFDDTDDRDLIDLKPNLINSHRRFNIE